MRPLRPLWLSFASLSLASCLTHEQVMVKKVEGFLARDAYEPALSYLDGYLGKHRKSLVGWRYRVMIRLDQGDRPKAAQEYADLGRALEKQEPDVLREVVLGAGGRWLLSDYKALARCAAPGVADAAFFDGVVSPKELSAGSMSKVAVSLDEIGAAIDALPGALPEASTWPIVARFAPGETVDLRARIVASAGRHLASGQLPEMYAEEAIAVVREGSAHTEPAVRAAARSALFRLPAGPRRTALAEISIDGLIAKGLVAEALGAVLAGPDGKGPQGFTDGALSRWEFAAQDAVRVVAAGTVMARPGATPSKPRSDLLDVARKSSDPPKRLAAAAVDGWLAEYPDPDVAALWRGLATDVRRGWAEAFVRNGTETRGLWAAAILGDGDAIVAQAGAAALAVPGTSPDDGVDAAIAKALAAMDPATRAVATRTAVVRGATSVGNAVSDAVSRGDDRVTQALLDAVRETGDPSWQGAVALALQSPVPEQREAAVDALVASCDPGRVEAMFALLDDKDPHVAVRAASGLYLLIGGR